MTDIVLYAAPGSCSRVPCIALEEIGLPFEYRPVVFMKGEHKAPDYKKLNPKGKVPCLVIVLGALMVVAKLSPLPIPDWMIEDQKQ